MFEKKKSAMMAKKVCILWKESFFKNNSNNFKFYRLFISKAELQKEGGKEEEMEGEEQRQRNYFYGTL